MNLEPITFNIVDHPLSKYLFGNRNPQICSDCGTNLRRVGLKGNALKEVAAALELTLQPKFECPHRHVVYWIYPEKVRPISSSDMAEPLP